MELLVSMVRRSLRLTLGSGVLVIFVLAQAARTDGFAWAAGFLGFALACTAVAGLKTLEALSILAASEVRLWMRPVAYLYGVIGVPLVVFALWRATMWFAAR